MTIPEECLENGHSFVMRTHDVAPTPEQMEAAGSLSDDFWDIDEVNSMISQLTTRNYVCDVCEHCGFTVGFEQSAERT